MANQSTVPSSPERAAAILDEALRRIDRAIPDPVDLGALRQALETEQAKGSQSLVALMKVGRRRALDRIRRAASKEMGHPAVPHGTPPPPASCLPTICETTTMPTGTVKWFNPTKGFVWVLER